MWVLQIAHVRFCVATPPITTYVQNQMTHPYLRMRHRSNNPCPMCQQHFETADKTQKYCSRACTVLGMRNKQPRVCIKCKVEKPYEEFPLRMPHGNRPLSCTLCYKPRPRHKPAKKIPAPKPCLTCKQIYWVMKSPSAVKHRKYCSATCAADGLRKKHKTCQVCAKNLPYDAFDFEPSAKGRRKTCAECASERERLREQKLGFMQTAGRMRSAALTSARRGHITYTIDDKELLAVHGTPCVLCGKPSCTVRRIFPELGYISNNVEGLCWLCGQLGTTKTGVLTDETVIRHARSIVNYADRATD